MTAAIYARVSTEDQDYQGQLDEARSYVKRQGWHAVEYLEKLSGKEGVHRPVLDQLLRDARNKQFGVVAVWKLDRFGRSALDTLDNIKKLDSFGVRFLCAGQSAILCYDIRAAGQRPTPQGSAKPDGLFSAKCTNCSAAHQRSSRQSHLSSPGA